VKTTIIALFAAVLVAAAPTVHARNVSDQQHKVFKKRHQVISGYAPWRVMRANGVKTGYQGAYPRAYPGAYPRAYPGAYPGTYGYAPSAPKDYTYENSNNAGGGGGGGGGGGM